MIFLSYTLIYSRDETRHGILKEGGDRDLWRGVARPGDGDLHKVSTRHGGDSALSQRDRSNDLTGGRTSSSSKEDNISNDPSEDNQTLTVRIR
jgi:hypothetical protein